MKKNLIASAALYLACGMAVAGTGGAGNGTAAGATGASYGGSNGFGKAELGYMDNWQTMNPVQREKIQDSQPKLASKPSAKPEWPAWVKVAAPAVVQTAAE
jgi:hypothetical protein